MTDKPGAVPGFLRGAPRMAGAPRRRAIRAGSFGLALQGAPWAFALLHDRPDDLLLWITRGQGRVVIDGLRRGVSMHSAVFLPAGTLFSVALSQGAQALWMQAPEGVADRMPRAPLHLRVRDGATQAELTGQIDTMAREIAGDRLLAQAALEAQAQMVAVWLHRQRAAGAADSPRRRRGDPACCALCAASGARSPAHRQPPERMPARSTSRRPI